MTTPNDDAPNTDNDLKRTVQEVVSDILGGLFDAGKVEVSDTTAGESAKATKAQTEADISSQVQEAIRATKAEDAADQRVASLEQQVADLKNALASKEKAPVQFRRVEKLMGWRQDEDS